MPSRAPHQTRAQSGRVCRKRRYDSETAARQELDAVRAKARADRDATSRRETRVHYCWFCLSWHLTSHRAKPC